MKEIAPDLWQVRSYRAIPPNMVNCFVIGDVLIDAATKHSGKRILRDVKDHGIKAHALTHAHPDHQGASHEVCEKLGIPFWCPEGDVPAAEGGKPIVGERQPDHPITQFFVRTMAGPGHPVDRTLREGDEVAGFRVIETPGHSLGHVVFWRESDRVLVLGDVLNNMNIITGIPGLHEPKDYLTPDPPQNRESIRKVAKLEPKLVVFGHGPTLTDTQKFVDFCESVPTD